MSDPVAAANPSEPAQPATLLGADPAANPNPADPATPAADAAPKNGEAGDAGGDPADKPGDTKPVERAAPEAYEFKPPEGVTLDAEVLGEFEAVARELNMPQAEAQALVERLSPKIAQRLAAQQTEALATASAEWMRAVQSDKEIGGDTLPANLAAASRALQAFGSPELRSLLEDSRLGNHPEVIRFMVRAGKAMGEDTQFIGGKASGAASKTLAERLYPTATH